MEEYYYGDVRKVYIDKDEQIIYKKYKENVPLKQIFCNRFKDLETNAIYKSDTSFVISEGELVVLTSSLKENNDYKISYNGISIKRRRNK